MNERVKTIVDQARKLTPEERADVFDDLLIDLHQSDADWNKAWSAEAERRWALYKTGEIAAHDADEVLSEIAARLEKRRSR